jgi:hypothetical protein
MKLKVGDLELDSQTTRTAPGLPVCSESHAEPSQVSRGKQLFAICGAVASTVGLAAFIGTLVFSSWLVVLAGVSAFAAFGAFITYFLIGWEDASRRRRAGEGDGQARSDAVSRTRQKRLLHALDGHAPATVDALITQLGWREEVLLATLEVLIKAGEVEEDLDLETGIWTYGRTTRLLVDERPLNTLSLDERLEAIEHHHHNQKVKK